MSNRLTVTLLAISALVTLLSFYLYLTQDDFAPIFLCCFGTLIPESLAILIEWVFTPDKKR